MPAVWLALMPDRDNWNRLAVRLPSGALPAGWLHSLHSQQTQMQ